MNGNKIYTGDAGKISTLQLFLKIDTEGDKTRGTDNLFQYFTTQIEKAPFLRRRRLDPCSNRSEWGEEEVRRVKANFTFENLESQDEVSSEASAFQREEVKLAKPFLIWHVRKTSH